jgi:hypothetical protein
MDATSGSALVGQQRSHERVGIDLSAFRSKVASIYNVVCLLLTLLIVSEDM